MEERVTVLHVYRNLDETFNTAVYFKWLQVPTASISVEGNPALNRVRWTHSGREIAVGDSEGQIVIYDVGEVWGSLPIILIHLFSFQGIVVMVCLWLKLVFEVHEFYKPYGYKGKTFSTTEATLKIKFLSKLDVLCPHATDFEDNIIHWKYLISWSINY